MPTPSYDAIIVGSGITGGWAAKELTEKGLNTLILEAGRPIKPEEDYVEHKPVWELKYRNWDQREEREKTQYVQRECYYACDEYSHKFFVKDSENPYTSDPGKHFAWIRGRQVGGKSLTWGRQSYRWSDLDFEANLRDGIAVDWPFAMPISRPGMTTSKTSPESADRPRVCRNFRTVIFFRRWNSLASSRMFVTRCSNILTIAS